MAATSSEDDVAPVVALTVYLARAKFVQPNLAVAQGNVVVQTDTLNHSGFRDEEPCQLSLRSRADVSRLRQYLKAWEDETLISTGKWWTVSNSNPIWLCIHTKLTKVIERNRHGTKLIECEEIVAIQDSLEEFKDDTITKADDSMSAQAAANFVMYDKKKRHDLFADWLIRMYGKEFLSSGSGILDVAGGKGELSYALLERGIPSTVLDPDPRLEDRQQSSIPVLAHALHDDGLHLLQEAAPREQDLLRNCSMIVGMHPDQATEPIVLLSRHLKVPFALLPCCVMPTLFPHRQHKGQPVRSYRVFCEYLQAMQEGILLDYLAFMGRNTILYNTWSSASHSTSENSMEPT